MSWFGLEKLFKRSAQPRGAHVFTEEDRNNAEVAQLRKKIQREEMESLRDRLAQLQQLRQKRAAEQQIAAMEAELYGEDDDDDDDDEEDEDDLFGSLLGNIVKAIGQPATPTGTPVIIKQKAHLSDEELQAMKAKIPKAFLKKARSMSDDELVNAARMYKPEILDDYDEDTLQRALKLIRT